MQIRSLEYVKQKGASGNKELAAMAQKMKLQTRAWFIKKKKQVTDMAIGIQIELLINFVIQYVL